MRIITLAATITGSAAQAAVVTIPQSGRLKSIRWSIVLDAPIDNVLFAVELSPNGAAFTSGTNDQIQSIDCVQIGTNFVTSGMSLYGCNVQRLIDFPLELGTRLYLNSATSGTHSALVRCFLDIA